MQLNVSVWFLLPLAVVVVTLGRYLYARYATYNVDSAPTAVSAEEYRTFPLVAKICETPDTPNSSVFRFRFGLPTPNHIVGLPIGKHLVLRYMDAEGRPVSRQYTPISSDETTRGYFELLIKLYPTGKMSQYLNALPLQSSVEVRGPLGMLQYRGDGEFLINRQGWKTQRVKKIGMIAGGSGLTPMYQIIAHIVRNASKDKTQCSLVFANVTESDILMRKELDALVSSSSQLSVFYTINKPREGIDAPLPAHWKGGVGFVDKDMITKHLPAPGDDAIILLCGPKPMTDMMQNHLKELNYTAKQMWVF